MLRIAAYGARIENRIRAGNAGCDGLDPMTPDQQRSRPPLSSARRRRRAAAILVVLLASTAGLGLLAQRLLAEPSASAALGAAGVPLPGGQDRADRSPDTGEEAGILPEGVSVFDDGYPGIARLNPELLDALRRAADDAATDGVAFEVNSGWRSPGYQARLLEEAVAEYGSESEAARWVATPETSAHVSGEAVDIGPYDAAYWLSQNGARYGLCQIYANESWHFELRAGADENGCPAMYEDASEGPAR